MDSRETFLSHKEDTNNNGVRRSVGFLGGISFIIGTMIGSGIFASSPDVIKNSGSVGLSLFVWAGCGVLVLMASICYIELGVSIPKSGGDYTYLLTAFGEMPAFLYAYTAILVIKPVGFSAILLTCGNYIVEPFFGSHCDSNDKTVIAKLLAAFFLGIIVFVNCASVRWATSLQIVFTAAKLLAIVIIITTGVVRIAQGYVSNFQDSFNGTSTKPSDIGYAFYSGLWAFNGWNNLNYVTEEWKNPTRNLPLSILIGIPLVTTLYILVNISYLSVLTSVEMATSNAVAVTIAYQLYGVMAWIIPLFVACSTFGTANGAAFSCSRLVNVAAREGHMPKLLAMVHTERRTPLPALVFICIMALINLTPKSSNFSTLVTAFSFAAWIFYGMTIAGLLWLRYTKPDLKRPYKVFILIPILVLLCAIYLVLAPFYNYPWESFYFALFILSGIPVYYLLIKLKVIPKFLLDGFSKLTMKLQLLANLSLPSDIDFQ